ncbi:MAG: RlmE family RNA methyltransferase [Rhodospirillaceae bacterium]|jgi:23S rRNA (uridine2552-2'-O)-methyltransferase|nr:RlmE family RNA methyltransferase [Rhodospirillaceae bacterium]
MLRRIVRKTTNHSVSSTRWLTRHLNDPFVIEAKRLGYRSRAAFKLIQLDDRFHFLRPGKRVVDLGAAPGGWTQVAVQRVKALDPHGGKVISVDILECMPIAGAIVLTHDFLNNSTPQIIKNALGSSADVVLSDISPTSIGHKSTDHDRILYMCEIALNFAIEVLAQHGTFIVKIFKGGGERAQIDLMKKNFERVRYVKPQASRAESSEVYLIAMNFRAQQVI